MGPHDYVFLHGGVQGSWVWAEALRALSLQTDGAFGRALALDIPGCGTKRGRATEGLGPDEVAAELIGDIESAGLRDILLVGHSQAGTILPRLLEQGAKHFRRVVYISCIAPNPGETVLNFRNSMPTGPDDPLDWNTTPPGDRPALMRAMFCNDMTDAEADAFEARLGQDNWPERTMQVSDWRYGHLGAVPASYVVCLRDATIVPAWQRIFAERFAASRLVSIDAGHQVMNTRPHTLAEVLRAEANLK
jgi:pimeloyl-ACP methyl ester carboxylesterase